MIQIIFSNYIYKFLQGALYVFFGVNKIAKI